MTGNKTNKPSRTVATLQDHRRNTWYKRLKNHGNYPQDTSGTTQKNGQTETLAQSQGRLTLAHQIIEHTTTL